MPIKEATFRDFRRGTKLGENVGYSAPRVAREFSQSNHLPNDAELKDGVCAAMSLQWIARSARGDDFWDYIVSPDGTANTIALQRREQQYSKLYDAWEAQNPYKGGKALLRDADAINGVIISLVPSR